MPEVQLTLWQAKMYPVRLGAVRAPKPPAKPQSPGEPGESARPPASATPADAGSKENPIHIV